VIDIYGVGLVVVVCVCVDYIIMVGVFVGVVDDVGVVDVAVR